MSNVAVIDPRPSLVAGHRPQAIVPHDMDSAYRLAKAVCMAGMAPKGLDTPEKAMVAIMHGLEIGLTPMAALQRIAVVNGRPTIWGDGAIGLVRGSGICEWVKERIEGEGDNRVAVCEAKRKGDPESIRRTFGVADAKRAGLWGKAGPWQQYPERMLQMRARAFSLRDGFADVLGGLYLQEELDNGASVPTPPAPPPAPALIEPPKAEAEKFVDAVKAAHPGAEVVEQSDPPDYETIRAEFKTASETVETYEALQAEWERLVDPHYDRMMPPDQEDITGLFRKAERRLEP